MGNIRKILIAAGCIILSWLVGYIIGRNHFPDVTETVRTDSVVVRDTIRQYIPRETAVVTDKKVLVEIRDTIRIHDTLYVSVPFEKRFYREEDYYAEVSGYNPRLDYIEVYPKTVTVSRTQTVVSKPSPWHLSLGVGLDYSSMGSQCLSPNVGAEIGYKRISVGAELGLDVGVQDMAAKPYWQFGIKYNIFAK